MTAGCSTNCISRRSAARRPNVQASGSGMATIAASRAVAGSRTAAARGRSVVTCSVPTRRDALLLAGTAAASALWLPPRADAITIKLGDIPVENLSPVQAKAQQNEYRVSAERIISKYVEKEDASLCFRLVFNDAATYDAATKTGGMDGSVVLPEELGRPENKMLEPLVKRLAEAKAEIDGKAGERGPISWADLAVLAAKVSAVKGWRELRVERAGGDQGRASTLIGFMTAFDVPIGRIDGAAPGLAGKLPQPGASVEEVKVFLNQLNNKDPAATLGNAGNPFKPQAPYGGKYGFLAWTSAALNPEAEEERLAEADSLYRGLRKDFVQSRDTVTRTNYEVDFIETLNKIASLGAKFDRTKYCVPIKSSGDIRL